MSPSRDSNIFSFLETFPAEEKGESVLFFREAGIQGILDWSVSFTNKVLSLVYSQNLPL